MKTGKLSNGIMGFLIGVVFCSLAMSVYAANTIKSTTYSDAKIYFYGQEVSISDKIAIIEETTEAGKTIQKIYFPRELMEYMQFKVNWNKDKNTINLTMSGNNGNYQSNQHNGASKDSSGKIYNNADAEALDIMQRTGNWSYIEPYLSKMTNAGIDAVVKCYNSKHPNVKEHKKASNYYN